jgi:3-hydroxyisobutyrate dehydrogenase-like beta-hydroxyacid dehydrogenase
MFVGGAEPDVARARPVLEAMGKTITHLGQLGSGQAGKAVNQVIISGMYLGVAEGIVLGMKAGLDPVQLVAALSGGSAQSWVLTNRSGRMIDDQYPLGFRLALHRKDLGIALEMADGLGLGLPVARLAAAVEDKLISTGHGDEDMSVLAHAVRTIRVVTARAGLEEVRRTAIVGDPILDGATDIATDTVDPDRGPV